jgi:hypothetical protein
MFFERLYEFRLDEGRVLGFGAEWTVPVSDRVQLAASATAYRHAGGGGASGMDWNQRRASVRLQWTMGAEPARRLPGMRGMP